MFTEQPEEVPYCLSRFDAQKMTPLHYAAMLNYVNVVEYLIKYRADISVIDNKCRTPLLLAANRLAWSTTRFLVQVHSDIFIKDLDGRNIVHYVIIYGGQLEMLSEILLQV